VYNSEDTSEYMELEAKELEDEIQNVIKNTQKSARDVVSMIVRLSKKKFAFVFYDTMLRSPRARFFLNHTAVNDRLGASLEKWLLELFCADVPSARQIRLRQMEVGAVHARIRVPASLVMRGFRVLKGDMLDALRETRCTPQQMVEAARFITTLLDICLSIMTAAYVHQTDRTIRTEEALRLFSVVQDIAAERETQRANLAEWAQNVFLSAQLDHGLEAAVPLRRSEFGLWFVHRAHLIFPSSHEYAALGEAIRECDGHLRDLQETAAGQERLGPLLALKTNLDEITAALNLLFKDIKAEGSVRDPLTKLFNRRFLSTIVSREIRIHKEHEATFCLITLSVENYEELARDLPREALDDVIRRCSRLIIEDTRSTDPIFRMSEGKFLVLKVECNRQAANSYVRKLSERLAMEGSGLAGPATGRAVFGYAIVEYDGHPDPRYVIRLSEQAATVRL